MVRRGLFACIGTALVCLLGPVTAGWADPSSAVDSAFQNTLAVQRALETARHHLLQADAQKAVQILEEHLPRINGNPAYLKLLRDSYRTYVKDLWLARQPALAQKYLERLTILDSSAASDPTLRGPSPAGMATQKEISPPAAAAKPNTPVPTAVRAKNEDPFDPAHQRLPGGTPGAGKVNLAAQLLTQAENEFSQRRYTQARVLYEQAHQADQKATANCRQRWAYCKLTHVVDQLNQAGAKGMALADLQREVQAAVALAPNLGETGKWLLGEIDQRSRVQAQNQSPAELPVAIQHWPRNAQGWQVAETAYFRILHNQNRDLAAKVAQVAEHTRRDMYHKWFGGEAPAWQPKCDLYLHATAEDYHRATGVPAQSPGHSRIETDVAGARIVNRRMDLHCDNPTMLQAVLPHETTHVVLAGMFGPHPVPRWADEGIAVLTEPADKVEQHRRNLLRFQQEGQLFAVKELLQLQDYPQPRRIGAFYAQSVFVVDFLARQRGPQVLTAFVRDGLREGYEAALRKHYGFRDFAELQTSWDQQLAAEVNRTQTAGLTGR